jgi:hypothetical protein
MAIGLPTGEPAFELTGQHSNRRSFAEIAVGQTRTTARLADGALVERIHAEAGRFESSRARLSISHDVAGGIETQRALKVVSVSSR